MSAILEIKDLRLDIADGRHRTPILRGVDLAIEPGEIHGLVGESGAGKSMIGQVILGLAPRQSSITGGRVTFGGRDITSIPERERRGLMGKGLALIPQDPVTALNPARRIGKQITDTLELHLGYGRGACEYCGQCEQCCMVSGRGRTHARFLFIFI